MKVQTPEPGGIAESISGRDAGRLYMILAVRGDRILLADGKYRSCSSPKEKNAKHVRLLPVFYRGIAAKAAEGKDEDSEIRAALKKTAQEVLKK
ncbi:MAG TPA: KOW domain-containing RNA-binding protein [Candidatus Borkfalkia avistercoris]|uniref:KOW domain-containing RNA-binding protein n=1 Tax=Candidatus Borkfalkia avistercoris TaxID=2838504 RepID=A0A9D2IC53_9FIRM|nr:KOW domain-containing RNA-binding protein [Candidatus Borkfalkia avistercoris]